MPGGSRLRRSKVCSVEKYSGMTIARLSNNRGKSMRNEKVFENRRSWLRNRLAVTRAVVAILPLLVIATLNSCSKPPASAQKKGGGGAAAGPPGGAMPPMPVDVDTARAQSIVDAVRATGRIEAVNAVDLRPDADGRVTQLLFFEGQNVSKGQALLRIDDALLRAQAARASADRDLARQQLARVKRLREQNASSPADLERAEAQGHSADAALALLQLQIDRATVRAPFSGVVGQRFVSVGDYVNNGIRLLTLQTVDPQRAVIEVPERHAVQLSRGQELEFTVAAQPGRVFKARVEFIDPVVNGSNRTILVKANAPNHDRLLRPGMFIEARLATTPRP